MMQGNESVPYLTTLAVIFADTESCPLFPACYTIDKLVGLGKRLEISIYIKKKKCHFLAIHVCTEKK